MLAKQKNKQIHFLARLNEENLDDVIVPIIQLEKEIVLAEAHCRCARCGTKKALQYHHLILRTNREYINDDVKYIRVRHCWKNVIILCERCHAKQHNFPVKKKVNNGIIPEERIREIKKKYNI